MLKEKRKPTVKIFVDSSVLIAASISSKGYAYELLVKGFQGEFDLYISEDVIEESERNIKLKTPNSLKDFYIVKDALAGNIVKVKKNQILKVTEVVHIKDAPIVAGALKAKADYLVSFDRKHLLQQAKAIKTKFKIKVITPDIVVKG